MLRISTFHAPFTRRERHAGMLEVPGAFGSTVRYRSPETARGTSERAALRARRMERWSDGVTARWNDGALERWSGPITSPLHYLRDAILLLRRLGAWEHYPCLAALLVHTVEELNRPPVCLGDLA